MSIETYLVYLAAVIVFFATPPDTSQLLVISNSIQHGLRRSAFSITGDLSANCIQMTAAAFGLAAIIATSAQAFIWIKWLGVGYLAFIGLQLFFSNKQKQSTDSTASAQRLRLFRQGFFTSMANPFAIVFFAALFPQFIDLKQPVLPQLLILGSTYIIIDGLILIVWGYLGVRAANALANYSANIINKVCGALMVCAAVLLSVKDFDAT